jgi:ribose 5-phosphate isomerase A
MPFAWQLVKQKLERMGATGGLRQTTSGDGLVVTSHGSLVLDMTFDSQLDSKTLNDLLNNMAGIVEHGIFYRLSSAVFCVLNGQVQEQWATC